MPSAFAEASSFAKATAGQVGGTGLVSRGNRREVIRWDAWEQTGRPVRVRRPMSSRFRPVARKPRPPAHFSPEKGSSRYNAFFLGPAPGLGHRRTMPLQPPTSYAVFREAVLGPIYSQKVPKTGK